jgi:hypothetical protein
MIKKRRKPVVGEDLWLIRKSYNRTKEPEKGIKCKVRKVGRKYFYIDAGRWLIDDSTKFSIDDWYESNNTNYKDYILESEKERLDEILNIDLTRKITNIFRGGLLHLSLDAKKRIIEILESENPGA